MNICFEDSSVNTTIWCMGVLEANGIQLHGMEMLKPNTRRLLLHVKEADVEILIEREEDDNAEGRPVYHFVRKFYSPTVTFTSLSCSFTIE